MKTLCALCKVELDSNFGSVSTGIAAQGICPKCMLDLELQTGLDLCKYIDRLEEPVLVVDKDQNIRGANQAAQRAVSKDLPSIVDRRIGNVFECAYSQMAQGCGQTEHCSGCTVRRAIQETFTSGAPVDQRLVEVVQWVEGQQRLVNLKISTQRLTNCVLMQVEYA